MILTYRKIKSFDIKRRTFEGKNDSSLTSKYMPSYKYWLKVIYEDNNSSEDCFRTKQEALKRIEDWRRKEGQVM